MESPRPMPRRPEPELMDNLDEAEAYARADFSAVNQAFVDRLVRLADDAPGCGRGAGPPAVRVALDLGTGPADIPVRLLAARPAWRVVALDAAPAMLALARSAVRRGGLGRSIRLVLADAKRTPLPPASFGVIYSNSLLHHLGDPDRFWAEVARVGEPGALVFVRDLARPPTPHAAGVIVARHAGAESALLREEFYRSLLSAYTLDEVREQLARAGVSSLTVASSSDRHLDVVGNLPAAAPALQ